AGHSGEADDCNLPAGIVGIAASGPGTAATPPAPRPNCGLPTTTTTTGPPAGSRPNFIVINTDDQRLEGTMAIMPKTRQWIADAGTSFPEGFATTPLCCPSRSGLFSGRYTHNHGNLNNQTTDNLDQNATMQKYLHDAGYQTGMVGKFLLHWSNSTRPPNFDYWALTSGGYYDVSYGTDQGSLRADYTTWETRRQAERILSNFEKRDQDPFFLYIAPQAPHDPWEPETAYKSAAVGTWSPSPAVTETDRSDKPAWVRGFHVDQAEGAQLRAAQLRLLKSVDDMIDAVMRRLTTLGEANNTVVIFTSDNGYLWGEHGVKSKYNPYDQSVRVPFYVRWPGKVAAGAVDRRPVGNVDIAPSLLAAAGISPRLVYPFDGKPFLSPSGLSSVVRPEAYLEYFVDEHRSIPDWFSIRTTKFNYVEYRADGKTIFREYYDLVADPWELRNLLG
ncbi:MAG: sulfatase family protein, partial [Acidimicrobiia bacterium]